MKEKKNKREKKTKTKKINHLDKIFSIIIVSLLIGLLIVLIVTCFCVKYMTREDASVVGALIGASATITMGAVSYYQNLEYKKLSDLANKRTQELMIIPELTIQMIHSMSYESELQEMNLQCSSIKKTVNKSIVCVPLNLAILDITVEKIDFKNDSCSKSFDKSELKNNGEEIRVAIPNMAFSIRIAIPEEFLNNSRCKMLISYKNIYHDRFEKYFDFEIRGERCVVNNVTSAQLLENDKNELR